MAIQGSDSQGRHEFSLTHLPTSSLRSLSFLPFPSNTVLSIYIFIYLSIYLFIYLSIYLSICIFTYIYYSELLGCSQGIHCGTLPIQDGLPCSFAPTTAHTHTQSFLQLAAAIVVASLTVFGFGVPLLSSLVGFAYPAIKSFQAIETKNKGDDTQWLVYWLIFALFSMMENFVNIILYWIPFYYAFKLAFLLWAMLPQTKGAKFLYDSFLKDFLKKNESKIDAALQEARKHAAGVVKDVTDTASVLKND